MASFGGGGGGGYSRTNYGAQGGDDGGGFMGSQQGSQSAGGTKSYADDSLRPITIKQLVDCKEEYPGAELKIDGAPVTQVTVVGQVRSVNPQTTNTTYRLDDGTALIDVKKWVDTDKPEATPNFEPDTYVRVMGRIQTYGGKKHIGAHFIRAIEDFNEVNYHLLEATYVHLCLTKGMPGGPNSAAAGGNAGGGGGDGMFVDGGGGGDNSGLPSKLGACSRNAQTVFKFLNNTPGGNEGLHLNMIASGTGLSVRDVMAAGDDLLNNGMVYTTIDDETWAILDY
ncbi:hypothetical protein B0H63DRAFT_112902 [Podospora didyma]|uniref:Replication factor A protein 2 n=1 Tax=Podospora didyma TaxID=330526 RepID=A0AAE0NZB1_9PEZI|nr:hypothetical protein B0H63DRAFT_112902 [Podospora didyma]